MKYHIKIEKLALKFIARQTPAQRKRIIDAINLLPDKGDIVPYKGEINTYRLRVGDYRIVYEKHDDVLLIIVIRAGNRGDVYK